MLNGNSWMMLGICVASGIILSTIIGAVYSVLKLPLIIISLGMVIVYESLSNMMFEGKGARAFSVKELSVFGGMPQIFIIFALVFSSFLGLHKIYSV